MSQLVLTPHQQEKLHWLVVRITEDRVPVVALRGLAGTGKSTMIPALAKALETAGMSVAIGAPTHRAAMILRKKGLRDADTLHSLALAPYFQPAYACAMDYLSPWIDANGEVDEEAFIQAFGEMRSQYMPRRCPTHVPYIFAEYCDEQGIPELVAAGMAKYSRTLQALNAIAVRYQDHGPRKALESIGIHGRNFFDGFGPKLGMGCLIIDEASMVDEETLALCSQAFPHICLIGDHGQLSPVKGKPILAHIEGVELTEIHRQANKSPIVQLAYAARNGQADWHQLPRKKDELEEWQAVEAKTFLESPLIVWRNKTRINCTAAIREALGYPKDHIVVGEPLVCRSNSPTDRSRGFFNNAIFHVVEVVSHEPLRAVLVCDGKDDEDEGDNEDPDIVQLHIEEIHGESIHPEAIPFRFGYCLTAHTAQGGEWATVHIAKPDMLAYIGKCRASGPAGMEEGARWSYTAITRAKRTLGFMLNYDFTQSRSLVVTPSEAPMPIMTAKEEHPSATQNSFTEELPPDDIPEPTTPLSIVASGQEQRVVQPEIDPGTHAGQAVMTVDQAMYKITTHAATVLGAIEKSWDATLRANNSNHQAVQALTEALGKPRPYSASVNVTTPAGYPMRVDVQAASQEEFIERMGAMMAFLQDAQFTPGAPF